MAVIRVGVDRPVQRVEDADPGGNTFFKRRFGRAEHGLLAMLQDQREDLPVTTRALEQTGLHLPERVGHPVKGAPLRKAPGLRRIDPQAHRPVGEGCRYAVAVALGVHEAGRRYPPGVLHQAVKGTGRRHRAGLDKKTVLNVRPSFLIVPASLELKAEQLVAQNLVPAAAASMVPQSIRTLAPISEPRLDATSETAWYLAARPNRIDTIEYAYLKGQQGAYIETRNGFDVDVDGVEINCRLDFGAKAIDWRRFLSNCLKANPVSSGKYTMISAFAAIVDTLFADPNIGQEAVYITDGGAPELVRVVSRQADTITDFGDARLWSETTRIDLRFAEVPAPRPGDRVEIDGEAFLIQGEPVRDRERLVWTVDLRPA